MEKCTALLAGVITSAALVSAPSAIATPGDPHMPNIAAGNCPGGRGGLPRFWFCDGVRYSDGSFWHQWGSWAGRLGITRGHLACVVDNGTPLPPPAPPGGCGGAV